MVFFFCNCFCGLLATFTATVGTNVVCGLCCGSQSQVLSTSFWRDLHFFRYQRPNLKCALLRRSMARAARDFFKDFDILAPEISNFFLTHRGLGGWEWAVAQGHCNCWNKCWMWSTTATVGTICSTNSTGLSVVHAWGRPRLLLVDSWIHALSMCTRCVSDGVKAAA